jgi:hypothetical protein
VSAGRGVPSIPCSFGLSTTLFCLHARYCIIFQTKIQKFKGFPVMFGSPFNQISFPLKNLHDILLFTLCALCGEKIGIWGLDSAAQKE